MKNKVIIVEGAQGVGRHFIGYIYFIKNVLNNKYYIGQSVEPQKRFQTHISEAKRGSDILFHKAIKEYGEDNFLFEIVETLKTNSYQELQHLMNSKEVKYIKKFNSYLDGYNGNIGGKRGSVGYKLTKEQKLKLSKAKKGKSLINKGSFKKGQTSLFKGSKFSDETKALISKRTSEAMKSKEVQEKICKKVVCIETGQVFNSIKECANQLGLTNSQRAKISSVCKGDRKSTANLHFRYYEEENQYAK